VSWRTCPRSKERRRGAGLAPILGDDRVCNPEKSWSISSNLSPTQLEKPRAAVTGVTKLILNYQSSKRTKCLNSFHKKSLSLLYQISYINVEHSLIS